MAKSKVEAAVLAAVQDQLNPGESVQVVTVAFVDAPCLGLISAVAMVGALERRRHGIVLTDQQLLLVGMSPATNRVQGVVAAVPRGGLRATSGPVGLLMKAFNVVDGDGPVGKLSFAIPNRRPAEQIAAALGAAA